MAGGADFLIDLEAARERRPVIGAEDALEGPMQLRRRRGFRGATATAAGTGADQRRRQQGEKRTAHQAFSIGKARAGAAAPDIAPPFSTGSLMLRGRGSGRSNRASSGKITRKCR